MSVAVGIIEDNSLVRAGFRNIFLKTSFQIIVETCSFEAFLEIVGDERDFSAILIGIDAGRTEFCEHVRLLRRKFDATRVVAIASSPSDVVFNAALHSQVDGLILQSRPYDAIIKTLELIILGDSVFPKGFVSHILAHNQPVFDRCKPDADMVSRLSGRETEVLGLLGRGDANKVISQKLGVSESTVKVHVRTILRKTGAKNRTEAALLAREISAHLPIGPASAARSALAMHSSL